MSDIYSKGTVDIPEYEKNEHDFDSVETLGTAQSIQAHDFDRLDLTKAPKHGKLPGELKKSCLLPCKLRTFMVFKGYQELVQRLCVVDEDRSGGPGGGLIRGQSGIGEFSKVDLKD